MRGEVALDWHERGDSFEIDTTLDGAVRVYLASEGLDVEVTLSAQGVEALIAAVDEIAGGRGWIPEITHEQTLEDLATAEGERDDAIKRAETAEARVRELEAELVEMDRRRAQAVAEVDRLVRS